MLYTVVKKNDEGREFLSFGEFFFIRHSVGLWGNFDLHDEVEDPFVFVFVLVERRTRQRGDPS